MKRLTETDRYWEADEFWYDAKEPDVEDIEKIYNRLAAIEDILGDEYELDRLRELVEADKEGRCVVLPCKIGDTVYSIRHERVPDDEYRMSFHTEMRIISQKFGLNHVDCIGRGGGGGPLPRLQAHYGWQHHPWADLPGVSEIQDHGRRGFLLRRWGEERDHP